MKKIFTLIFIVFGITVSAQQYSYRQYTIFDGLPQNQVMSLCVDSDGFLWVGTKGGIARFDGQTFKKYKIDAGDISYIYQIVEFKNHIYISTGRSICVLIGSRFRTVLTVDDKIYNLFNSNENLYITYKNKILKLVCNKPELYYEDKNVQNITRISIIESSKTIVYRGDLYLNAYKAKEDKLVQLFEEGFNGQDKFGTVNFIYCENKDSTPKLITMDDLLDNAPDYKHGLYGFNHYKGLDIESRGNFVAASFTLDWERYDEYGIKIDTEEHLNSQINTILIDKDDNLWLATEKGLWFLESYAFQNYTKETGMPEYIWSIIESEDSTMVFAGYNGELVTLNRNNKIESININLYNREKYRNFYMGGSIDSNGTWYLPMGTDVLIKSDNSNKKISVPNYGWTFCVFENPISKQLYFGTNHGLFEYNDSDESCNLIIDDIGRITDIDTDKYGRMWLCASDKVQLFDGAKKLEFTSNEIPVNMSLVSCHKDNNGNMWLASKEGLYYYDYESIKKIYDGSFSFIDHNKNNLVAGFVYGIVNIDLDKFYDEKDYLKVFDRYNGFTGIECGQNGTWVDHNGDFWIPTSESVIKFSPDKIKIDSSAPKIFIYSVMSADSHLNWSKHTISGDSIIEITNIPWNRNNIKIEYHALEYNCPERVTYKYRLKGYSDSWTLTDKQEIVFTNLDPGEYIFEVYATNENNITSANPQIIKITINPAFWQTLIFKIATILLSIFVVVFAMYMYMRRKRKQEIEKRNVEQQLVSMQMNTINAQLDPHFVFNAISAIGTEVQENNSAKAYDYYVKVSRLLRSSLIDKDKITRSLKKELDVVKDYLSLQQFRFGERIKYEINIAPEIDLDTIVPKMCIQIFVENAVKHGLENKKEGGEIKINIATANNYLVVLILDNGIGRDAAAKINSRSTGTGLSAFTNFFEILNKYNSQKAGFTITDKINPDGTSAGTEVRLTIPEKYKFDSKMG